MKVAKLCSVAVLALTTACTEKSKDYCDTSTDCPLGQTCLTETHTCVTSALTVSPEGFFVADGFWWSTTTGPVVKGTVTDPKAVEIIALVGGVPASSPATIAGSDWSLDLNDMTIADTDTEIYFQLTGGDGISSITQTFRLDRNPPVVALADGHVFDERQDSINFGSNEPVHTHGGTPIALSADECTDVYRYGYLLTDPAPRYGLSTNANPLVYRFKPTDETSVDMTGAEYRVIQAGTTVLDWSPIGAPDEAGHYVVAIDAGGEHPVPQLATTDGRFDLEVRYPDLAGNVGMTSLCWNHHVLPAPLQVGPVQPAVFGTYAMPTWKLISVPHPFVSGLITTSHPGLVRLFEVEITQTTAEPIAVKYAIDPLAGTYAITVQNQNVLQSTTSVTCETRCQNTNNGCVPENYNEPGCSATPLPSETRTTDSGSLQATYRLVMFQKASSFLATGCSHNNADGSVACTIPPRGPDALPKKYELVLTIHDLPAIRSHFSGSIYEHVLNGLAYTGTAPTTLQYCASFKTTSPDSTGEYIRYCDQSRTYSRFRALDRIALGFESSAFTSSAARVIDGVPGPFTVVNVSTPAHTWDGGDDDLPGPN